MPNRTKVAGPLAVENESSGDGRMLAANSLRWDGVLPIPIIWDRDDGDHSGATLGAIETIERRGSIIWGVGYVEHSEVPEFEALVTRVIEILNQGAVGVSLKLDSEVMELRVKKELLAEEPMPEDVIETDESGDRVIVARFSRDDALEVTTSARVRHLAIVDTAALIVSGDERFGIAASAASGYLTEEAGVAASGLSGDWSACNWMADDPKFGDPGVDPRIKYDPDRSAWSCPPTVTDDGHFFGHITPMGICLRGRPDKCVTPPDGDLQGFMRARAPFAGGRRTGVVVCGEGSDHCDVGIGAALATKHYDKVGYAAADVCVGRDRYGVWFSGMIRPGCPKERIYELEASDVSGHWEYTAAGRMTLVGLPAVNVGGFPKGYLSYEEFQGGLAAAAGISIAQGCSAWVSEEVEDPMSILLERVSHLSFAVGELYAAHLRDGSDER